MRYQIPPHDVKQIEKRFFKPLRRLIQMNYFRFKVRRAKHIPMNWLSHWVDCAP